MMRTQSKQMHNELVKFIFGMNKFFAEAMIYDLKQCLSWVDVGLHFSFDFFVCLASFFPIVFRPHFTF